MVSWISAADSRTLAATIVAICGAIVAIVTVYRLPYINRPIRWVGRSLIAEPLQRVIHGALNAWADEPEGPVQRIDRRLSDVESQLRTNGGSSLRDRVNVVGRQVGAPPDPTLVTGQD